MIRYNKYIIEPNDCGGYVVRIEKNTIDKKTGKNYLTTLGYPSTFKGCLTMILKEEFAKTINENDLTLAEAIKELDKINKELTEYLDKIIKEDIE